MSDLDIFDASYDLRDLSPKQKAAVVRLMDFSSKETMERYKLIVSKLEAQNKVLSEALAKPPAC